MLRFLALALTLLCACSSGADYYERLQAGDRVYEKAYVLSANASALSIKHARGLSQVALAELEPELQVKYGYDAAKDLRRERELQEIQQRQIVQAEKRLTRALRIGAEKRDSRAVTAEPSNTVRAAFASFGQPPELKEEVDLRPSFRSRGIGIRRQRGPSCSVHAIVAALEFQYAEKQGTQVNISEAFLVEATSKTLGREVKNRIRTFGEEEAPVVEDEGFALEHVFQAIRGYGLEIDSAGDEAEQEALAESLRDVRFSPFRIPGERSEKGLANIVHVLNAQMPVVVGVAWPDDSRVRKTSLLSKQPPAFGAGHAVAIVGYRCPTGRLEDAKFIFRNSWGADWGAGGYGFFTYEYLKNHLTSSYVVELR